MTLVQSDILALLGVCARTNSTLARACNVETGTIKHAICELRKLGHPIWFGNSQYHLGTPHPTSTEGLTQIQMEALDILRIGQAVVCRRLVYQLRKLGWPIYSQRGGGYRLM